MSSYHNAGNQDASQCRVGEGGIRWGRDPRDGGARRCWSCACTVRIRHIIVAQPGFQRNQILQKVNHNRCA